MVLQTIEQHRHGGGILEPLAQSSTGQFDGKRRQFFEQRTDPKIGRQIGVTQDRMALATSVACESSIGPHHESGDVLHDARDEQAGADETKDPKTSSREHPPAIALADWRTAPSSRPHKMIWPSRN